LEPIYALLFRLIFFSQLQTWRRTKCEGVNYYLLTTCTSEDSHLEVFVSVWYLLHLQKAAPDLNTYINKKTNMRVSCTVSSHLLRGAVKRKRGHG